MSTEVTEAERARALAVGTSKEFDEDKRYREGVVAMLEYNGTDDISNGLPAHAVILYQEFIKHAEDTVRIYAKNLHSSVFNNLKLCEAAREASERGVTFKILVEEEPESTPFLNLAKELDFDMYKVPEALGKAVKFNFFTMDKHAHRYEDDNREIKALASAHNREATRRFNMLFDSIMARGSLKAIA